MIDPSRQLSLKLLHRCPACHAGIAHESIHVLSETESSILAHAHCEHCSANFVTHIVSSSQGIIGNAVPTDATFSEARKLINARPLSENDFLSLYSTVRDNRFVDAIRSSMRSN